VVHLRGVLIAFNKPFGVLSQFTPEPGSRHRTLGDFSFPPRVYAIGRLDADSEGLLLLSDEPGLNTRLLDPKRGHRRVYWAQVERVPSADALRELERGVLIQGKSTMPCCARLLEDEPALPPREPPVRFRKNVPTAWIELELTEGRNRQVRRMTAGIGHPTLRLVRVRIGEFAPGTLAPGEWREMDAAERGLVGV
jgi:23S rRNA pseudouridine2457 synthase